MNEDLTKLSTTVLLSEYKNVVRNPPFVLDATDEELDEYYDQIIDIEDEIKRRIDNK